MDTFISILFIIAGIGLARFAIWRRNHPDNQNI